MKSRQGDRGSTGCVVVMIGCLLLVLMQPAGWSEQPKPGGTLRVAWEADVTGFDPHTSAGVQAQYLVGNLFNSLVTIDTDLNFVPELAESWAMQDDGKTWIFHLRKGVQFHDGTDFDAAAVAWNFKRITDPAEKAFAEGFFDPIEAVEPVDAHTVQFRLKHPSLTLLPTLAVYRVGFLLMSPTSYKTWGREEVRLHPAGTGPFKLAKWEPNNLIVLEKHPNYFKPGLPYVDRLEFKIMKDGITRVTALRAGEVDFVNYVPREYVERLAKDPKVQVYRGRETQHLMIFFHNTRKPFDDVRVRQALAGYGIDRHAIAKSALLGQGQALWSYVPPGGRDHLDFGERFPYNPDKAKALLKEAGFDEKHPLKYTLTTHAAEPALPTVATIMKTQLAQIGVEVTIEIIDRPVFLRRLNTDRDTEQVINLSSNVFDPYARRFILDSRKGANPTNHQEARVNELLDQLAQTTDPAEYTRLGHDLQRYVTEHMLYASLTSLPTIEAAREHVKGYEFLHGFKKRFERAWLEKGK
jgi:peptide/nickel transport system substrate-binding protein